MKQAASPRHPKTRGTAWLPGQGMLEFAIRTSRDWNLTQRRARALPPGQQLRWARGFSQSQELWRFGPSNRRQTAPSSSLLVTSLLAALNSLLCCPGLPAGRDPPPLLGERLRFYRVQLAAG